MYIARTVRPRFDLARRRRARCTRARAVGVLETPSPPSPSSETHRQAKPSGDSIRNIQVLPFFYLPGPRRCTHRIEESEHARSPSRQPRPLCRFDAAGRQAGHRRPIRRIGRPAGGERASPGVSWPWWASHPRETATCSQRRQDANPQCHIPSAKHRLHRLTRRVSSIRSKVKLGLLAGR
jgi:hypothetical protein